MRHENRKVPVDALIDALREGDERLQRAAMGALEQLTRQNLGHDREAWLKWWEEHRADYVQ
jgi:hypothetical protein